MKNCGERFRSRAAVLTLGSFGGPPAGRSCERTSTAHLALQPSLRKAPVAHHGVWRDPQHRRGFLDAQPTEEPQLDDLALPIIEGSQRFQGVVECDEVLSRFLGYDERFVERDPDRPTASFLIFPSARVVDQYAPHHAGSHGEEVGPILPGHGFAVDQPDVRLVDERGGLQAMADSLARHAAPGNPVELAMDERNQPLDRGRIALSPFQEQASDLGRALRNIAILSREERHNHPCSEAP